MKKVILCTVVSLFVLGGMVATPFGVALAQVVDCLKNTGGSSVGEFVNTNPQCFNPNVEVVITISKNHKSHLYHPVGTPFENPTGMGGGIQNAPPDPPKNRPLGNLPVSLFADVPGDAGKYKESTITVYGNKTCMAFNGVYYCW